ncbi:unnamed protein product, partial [Owenia fusiformis]
KSTNMYMCGGVLVLFVVSLGNVVDGEVLGESCLAAHNKFRRMHQDTPDLTYSDDLAKSAQEWANYLTTIGFMKHSGPGQNIYWSGKPDKDHPCGPVVDFWYNEKQYYSYSTTESTNPDESTLHFTQVVWKNTKEVGCGLSTYNGGLARDALVSASIGQGKKLLFALFMKPMKV